MEGKEEISSVLVSNPVYAVAVLAAKATCTCSLVSKVEILIPVDPMFLHFGRHKATIAKKMSCSQHQTSRLSKEQIV